MQQIYISVVEREGFQGVSFVGWKNYIFLFTFSYQIRERQVTRERAVRGQ